MAPTWAGPGLLSLCMIYSTCHHYILINTETLIVVTIDFVKETVLGKNDGGTNRLGLWIIIVGFVLLQKRKPHFEEPRRELFDLKQIISETILNSNYFLFSVGKY